jgi:phosphoribosyl 1,2-cyclic phosphodiesterase
MQYTKTMAVHFCVLGSGSSGNAALIAGPDTRLLIDCGFSGDVIATRLKGTGVSWAELDAVLLTHTHTDHVRPTALRQCVSHGVALYCHETHIESLENRRPYRKLCEAGLVRTYDPGKPFKLPGGATACAVAVPHDSARTFAFSIRMPDGRAKQKRISYLSDVGHWTRGLTEAAAGADLLAIEFNHDEEMERLSWRPATLIDRVLGPLGHLSNRQAAEALCAVCRQGSPPAKLVLLHLSRECNRPRLAYEFATEALGVNTKTKVFLSRQDKRGSVLEV